MMANDQTILGVMLAAPSGEEALPPNGSRFCCGAPLDSNTDGQNVAAPSAASAG